jgi:UDP-2-acetamido-3-amino-2,3-dideoxy-glucuronate N-acetyltransferase
MAKRICVVGAGRWGRNHVRVLQELGCLARVVESEESVRRELHEAHPGVRTFAELDGALAEDFAGFVVATPAETHHAIALRILDAGKPVLVEKPMALTAAHAREIEKRARDRGVAVMVGHVLLFHPAIRKIKELVDGGKIGKLQYLYSNRLNLGTVRTEENILWSFAPHDISIFQHLIGDLPREVTSRGGAFVQPHIHDTTLTTLRYPQNVVAHIFLSWLHPYKEHRLVLIGSKGMLSFEDSSDDKNLLFYEKGIDWVRGAPTTRDGPKEVIPYEHTSPLAEELGYFVDHLDGRPIEIAGAASAVEVLDILELATESLLSGESRAPAFGEPPAPGPAFFVHPSSYVDDDVEIGEGTRIWHFSHVQSGARIGSHCSLGQNVNVGSNVRIGDFVKIQNNVSVYEGVEIEDHVFCGPSMVFTNVPDPRAKYPQRGAEFYRPTRVREGASIGANATVLCGNCIGRHAFVGAGAVVTEDVPDYALMMGVPARRAGWVCECGETLPDFEAEVTCGRCGAEYRFQDERVVPDV